MFERLIWVVPAAVVLFGVWRPRAGLLVLAACLPLFGVPPGGPYLAALDLAAIAAIITGWRGGRPEPSPLVWPAAAFVAVSLLSLVPSPYQPPAWQPSTLLGLLRALPSVETWSAFYTWRAAVDLLLGWGLFLAVRRAFAGRSAAPLAKAFLAGLTGVLVFGIASQAGFLDLSGFRPQYESPVEIQRLYSVFFLSGWLSEYLVLVTPLAIAALAAAGRLGRRMTLPFLALAIACLGLTQQRGAWVAVLAQCIFLTLVFLLRRRDRRPATSRAALQASAILVLTAGVFIVTGSPVKPILERASSIESGLSTRLPIWKTAAEMAGARPLLGWGLGSFSPAYDLVHPRGSAHASRWRNTAHSLYLDVAAERGALGLFALGLLGWSVATCLLRARAGQEAMALALGVTFVGAIAYGLVQYLFHLRNIAWIVWLLLGCVTLVVSREVAHRSSRDAKALFVVALLLIPVRALLADPPDYAGNHAFGFHEREEDPPDVHWWTEGSAARRIPWLGETLTLTLANGHPKASERPANVLIRINGEVMARLKIVGGWEDHSFDLGPPTKKDIVLTLQVRPTFRPFVDFREYSDLQPSLDIRSLGVALREPRWD